MAMKKKYQFPRGSSPNKEELLVFGYSCKLFRDDAKALAIDQGKHLIPWMGREELRVDRYDARATLSDLSHLEAPSGGFEKLFGLTDTERRVEALCDEERYRALHTNEEEERLYKEEERKRLEIEVGDKGSSYGQVQYQYEGKDGKQIGPVGTVALPESAETTVFKPSPLLDIPLNMVLPETYKQNAVIEKTAGFICSQGSQMEILLKMKQAGNSLFDFLSFDHSLHAYYRLVLCAVKSGRYKPLGEEGQDDEEAEEEDDHYLHPSLAPAVSKVELAPSIPTIAYKPSENCAYTMLVSKLRDKASSTQTNLDDLTEQSMECEEMDSEPPVVQDIRTMPIVIPPPESQAIILKMASYVAKNGDDFENVVKSKKDPRFDFLASDHQYRFYYETNLAQYRREAAGMLANESAESNLKRKDELEAQQEDAARSKIAPVCFSIKSKEAENLIEKSTFPLEESSEEEDGSTSNKNEQIAPQTSTGTAPDIKPNSSKTECVVEVTAPQPVAQVTEDKSERTKRLFEIERIKDKLTAAVREKVANAQKEKMIQLERKKRVAAFLKSLNPTPQLFGSAEGTVPEYRSGSYEVDSDVASLPDVTDLVEAEVTADSPLILGKRPRSESSSISYVRGASPSSVVSASSNNSQTKQVSKSSKSRKAKKKSRKHKKKKHKHKKSSKKHKKHKKRSSTPDTS